MSKALKKHINDSLQKRFGEIDSYVLVDYQGLDSARCYDLRRSLNEAKTRMTVVPNRLAVRILDRWEGKKDNFKKLFRGPTALVYAPDGAIGASRLVMQWKKKNKDFLRVKGGVLQGEILSPKQIEDLSKLPDKPQLLARVAGAFQSPLSRLAYAAQWPLAGLARTVEAYRKKLAEGSPAGAEAGGAEPSAGA
jgi:large subunit ribosomal protein L10